jgi:lysophospholipase L1-like esterase
MLKKALLCLLILLAAGIEFTPANEAPGKEVLRILCLGDSITQSAFIHGSYRYYLWKKMVDAGMSFDFVGSMKDVYSNEESAVPPDYKGRKFDADHEGHWGWTADQILGIRNNLLEKTGSGKLSAWLKGYTPDIVLLHLGHNDAGLGEPADQTKEELKKIISLLREDNSNVSILIAKVIPTDDVSWNRNLMALNDVIEEIAKEMTRKTSRIAVVDFTHDFYPEKDTFDGIHPNAVGAEKMAGKWFDGILSIIEKSAL